jgi:hypothetical protein
VFANLISTQNQTIYVILILAIFLFLLFLPTLLELKKPKDAGPRRIAKLDSEEEDAIIDIS